MEARGTQYVQRSECVVCATLDGRLGALDTKTGRLLEDLPFAPYGAPTVGVSLDSYEDRLAAGTIDGRVLVYRLDRPNAA